MNGTLADVFKSSLFTTTSLTAAILQDEVAPSRIGDLGIFEADGVPTTSIVIEKRGETLVLVPSQPRGSAGTPMRSAKRSGISLEIPHYPVTDQIVADDVQNVRQFGSADELQGVQDLRDRKLNNMNASLSNTEEFVRIGAIQGQIYDADGTTKLFDLFDEFDVEEPDPVFLNLGANHDPTTPASIRGQLMTLRNNIRIALKNAMRPKIWAPCGDDFWAELIDNPEIRQTFLNQQEASELRNDNSENETLFYGGCLFEHYPGFGSVEIPTGDCRFVPMGVRGLFITRYAPAPLFSAVNRKGLPRYALATLDISGEKSIDLEAQTNVISICTRPEVLYRGNMAAS